WDRESFVQPARPAAVTVPDAPHPADGAGDGRDGDDPVLHAVVQAVAEVGGHPAERVVREARFYEDLGFDSVMIMQLKNQVEARLPRVGEVSVQEMLPALRSVGALADFLSDVLMARSS
ncbi:acyl carrier protein, partial [Streptomyces virginiae]